MFPPSIYPTHLTSDATRTRPSLPARDTPTFRRETRTPPCKVAPAIWRARGGGGGEGGVQKKTAAIKRSLSRWWPNSNRKGYGMGAELTNRTRLESSNL